MLEFEVENLTGEVQLIPTNHEIRPGTNPFFDTRVREAVDSLLTVEKKINEGYKGDFDL